MRAQRFVMVQNFIRAQQQFRKINHAFALALCFIRCENFLHPALKRIARLDVVRAQTFLFRAVDEVLHLFGRITLGVNIHAFEQPFDRRELILRVENLKGGGQICIAVVCA